MCIYTDDVNDIFNRAIDLNAQLQETVRDGDRVFHRFKDPFGYIWKIGTKNLIPQAVFSQASHGHCLLLIHHKLVRKAITWYTNRFGAVVFHEEYRPAQAPQITRRAFLRLGPVGRHLIIEILESNTIREPKQENQSKKMICIYPEDFHSFIERVMVAEDALIFNILDRGNLPLCNLRDPFGYLWTIYSSNWIPNEVLNSYN